MKHSSKEIYSKIEIEELSSRIVNNKHHNFDSCKIFFKCSSTENSELFPSLLFPTKTREELLPLTRRLQVKKKKEKREIAEVNCEIYSNFKAFTMNH